MAVIWQLFKFQRGKREREIDVFLSIDRKIKFFVIAQVYS